MSTNAHTVIEETKSAVLPKLPIPLEVDIFYFFAVVIIIKKKETLQKKERVYIYN